MIRRILRRASRFAHNLGWKEPLLTLLVDVIDEHFGETFEEIRAQKKYIAEVIRSEEQRFLKTLENGLSKFSEIADKLVKKKKTEFPGSKPFYYTIPLGSQSISPSFFVKKRV